jgi:hypothetical protein
MTVLNKIVIAEYSEQWPLIFADLKKVYQVFFSGVNY